MKTMQIPLFEDLCLRLCNSICRSFYEIKRAGIELKLASNSVFVTQMNTDLSTYMSNTQGISCNRFPTTHFFMFIFINSNVTHRE